MKPKLKTHRTKTQKTRSIVFFFHPGPPLEHSSTKHPGDYHAVPTIGHDAIFRGYIRGECSREDAVHSAFSAKPRKGETVLNSICVFQPDED